MLDALAGYGAGRMERRAGQSRAAVPVGRRRRRPPGTVGPGANKLGAASAVRAATVTKYGRSNWIRPPRPKHGISDTPRRLSNPCIQRKDPTPSSQPRRKPTGQLRTAHGRRMPDANRPAHPSLRRAQNPPGPVQTRGHAMPEALRGSRDLSRPHRPTCYLTNMRASKARSTPRSRSANAAGRWGCVLRPARSGTATTTRWPRASSPRSNASSSTGVRSALGRRRKGRCSISSKGGTTPGVVIAPWGI